MDKSQITMKFVGIKRIGATCALNALIQVLFHLTQYRERCLSVDTVKEKHVSVAKAVQHIFHELYKKSTAVRLTHLVKALNWSDERINQHQDVHELTRELIEDLDNRIRNNEQGTILCSLFEGKYSSEIRCKHVDYTNKYDEPFKDIQLTLGDDVVTLEQAFQNYIKIEELEVL